MKIQLLLLSTFFLSISAQDYQKIDNNPTVLAHWEGDNGRSYGLRDSCLEETTYFNLFNKEFFLTNQLPETQIKVRNQIAPIQSSDLNNLLNQSVQELSIASKKPNSDLFTIYKDIHYDYKNHTGTIILGLKKYPIVVKLYRETPQSLVAIEKKDLKQIGMFLLGGGTHRYLTGFTRIPNATTIQEKCSISKEFSDVDVPHKWYWQPKNNKWITVHGLNFKDSEKSLITTLPSTYAVITEFIAAESKLAKDKTLKLARFLSPRADANPDNFVIEKETGKTIVVDTEHFASMIGIRKQLDSSIYQSYAHYWKFLITKGFKEIILRDRNVSKDKITPV